MAQRKERRTHPTRKDVDKVLLVDYLWRLKTMVQQPLNIHIPTNLLVKDREYRREILKKALDLKDPAVARLVSQILELDREIPESSAPDTRSGTSVIGALLQSALGKAAVVSVLVSVIILLYGLVANSPGLSSEADAGSTVHGALTGVNEPESALQLPVTDPTILFRVHGSNTVGEKLAPALLESFFEKLKGVERRHWVVGENPVERQLQLVMNGRVVAVELHAHGSSTAFESLQSRTADIGMSSRQIKPEEVETLKTVAGDLSQHTNQHVISLDGLAVIVHPGNTLQKLDKVRLAGIFGGRIRNWKELGGADAPITLYARDDNSGTWDTFKSLVLKPLNVELSDKASRFESSTELSAGVAADKNAIGFIGLQYVANAKALAIAEDQDSLSIYPTQFTVATEDYPLARRLYFYTPDDNGRAGRLVREFIQYVLSMQGQTVVEQVGLVSQNVKLEKPAVVSDAPEQYRNLSNHGQRLSLNFRFNSGSYELDTKGKRDIERIIEYLSLNPGRSLMLFGFSDNIGSADTNHHISLLRARVVEEELMRRGVMPLKAVGFGEALPVASNDTDYGRDKNRRVEVWLL